MKTTNNTVLITGGSAGIGLEIARLLHESGNQVIITGRSKTRLQQALLQLPGATGIVSDVSDESDVNKLVEQLKNEFPTLNIIVNNAGRALLYRLTDENVDAAEKALDEMITNYISIIRLNEKVLPLLKQQEEAAIVNVSSIVAFVPGSLATYSASKAALHSYTQSLRLALENSAVKVFELMPPLVDTEFSGPIGGASGIHPSLVAADLLDALAHDRFEIHVGKTAELYRLYLSSPEEALNFLNGHRKQLAS
jgi:uncharacterized oxidoreductase